MSWEFEIHPTSLPLVDICLLCLLKVRDLVKADTVIQGKILSVTVSKSFTNSCLESVLLIGKLVPLSATPVSNWSEFKKRESHR